MNIAELRKVAEGATPGPWEPVALPWTAVGGSQHTEWQVATTWIHGQLKDRVPVVGTAVRHADDPTRQHGVWLGESDARHIATFHPALVLRMLAIIEAAQTCAEGPSVDTPYDGVAGAAAVFALGKAIRELPIHDEDEEDKP